MPEPTVDLSSLAHTDLAMLAEINLFVAAGISAIRRVRNTPGGPDELTVALARQGRSATRRLPALGQCTDVLTIIAAGRRPVGDLEPFESAMLTVRSALADELARRERHYEKLIGRSDL